MDWSEIDKIKKFPSSYVVNEAMKIGIKDRYNSAEYNRLNQNGDIKKLTKGDALTFVILCHELNDKSIIKKSIK